MNNEIDEVKDRYQRRKFLSASLYDPLSTSICMTQQEKERAIIRWLIWSGLAPVKDKLLLEVGCGSGSNLQQMLRLGFQPENLKGNELLTERVSVARRMLPASVEILPGDATVLDLQSESFDIVFQSTVFSSILDDQFQQVLADRMWSWTKPGGGVLWYDFIYNNPANHDVKGVPVRRIKTLFPHGDLKIWRITLAPPISRFVTKIHPSLYTLFNTVPLLRTHVLCWIRK